MENEIRKTIRLSKEEYDVVESVREEKQLPDFSKALCYLLHDYSRKQEEIQSLQQKNQKLEEENRKQMTRIRLASNGADVNTQTVIEILNTLCWQMQIKDFRSTGQMLHPAVEEAQKLVKERIANFKQKKDFKENKDN